MSKELGYKLFQTERNVEEAAMLLRALATQQVFAPLVIPILDVLETKVEAASPRWLALKERILDAPDAPTRIEILWERFAKDFGDGR